MGQDRECDCGIMKLDQKLMILTGDIGYCDKLCKNRWELGSSERIGKKNQIKKKNNFWNQKRFSKIFFGFKNYFFFLFGFFFQFSHSNPILIDSCTTCHNIQYHPLKSLIFDLVSLYHNHTPDLGPFSQNVIVFKFAKCFKSCINRYSIDRIRY